MTKSPVTLAREAVRVAQAALPNYSHRFSPTIFTQQPLFAILVLRQFSKTDCRRIVELLHDFADLRRVLKVIDHAQSPKGVALGKPARAGRAHREAPVGGGEPKEGPVGATRRAPYLRSSSP
jgi:hypothetical protein